ncbi:MAG: glycoside hydrolase family 13 protein [Trueperaceae bacterium]
MSLTAPPSWVEDAIFYQIFPDRFARSTRVPKPDRLEPWDSTPTLHGYKGGDLLGVSERLDLLAELGINALYFTPVFQSASNHRYHTHDYYRIDPMLGGNGALEELIERAHDRGMRIILDGVFNHASRGFFQFSDILENGPHSAYLDWFHVRRFPLNAYGEGGLGYDAWWNLPALPKFNTDTPAVREYLWEVAEYWLRAGIDGWRLDVPNEIDDDSFWQEFRRRCRSVNPDCYLVGEIWGDADRWLQGDQFDAVMNYPFTRAALGFVANDMNHAEIAKCGYVGVDHLDAAGFANEATRLLARRRQETTFSQLNLIGSHDTPRALNVLCEDRQALRMAFLLLMTFPGAPCVYYGDEIGLSGGHDPYCRGTIPWDEEARWDHGLRDYVQQLISLRHENSALRRGEFKVLHATGGLLLFARQDGRNRVIVALNRDERQLPLDFAAATEGLAGEYHDPISGLRLTVEDRRVHGFDVPPRRGTIYLHQG